MKYTCSPLNICVCIISPGTEQERERQLPLPDLLTDNQSSSEDSMSSGSSGEDNPQPEERAVERVAIQLRTIGDEMNAVFLQRVRIVFV